MRYQVLALAFVLVGWAGLVRAQEPFGLHIAGGRVTLHAQEVPVRTILAEWARLGGATVVNGERVAGPPVTLELEGVPERQALDIILRGVSGYLLAAKEPGKAGASMFDRVIILPMSAAPRNPPSAPAPVVSGPVIPGAPGTEDGLPPMPRPVAIPRPTPSPAGTPVPPPAEIDTDDDAPEPAPPVGAVTPTPGNPFGLPPGSSARPGVVTPAPALPPRSAPRDTVPN